MTFGNTLNYADGDAESQRQEKILAMGGDEQWEAMPKGMAQPKTWWRKWIKLL